MNEIIMFICSGLLTYWASRMILLMRAPAERFDEVLDSDLWWGRHFVETIREMFVPVMTA